MGISGIRDVFDLILDAVRGISLQPLFDHIVEIERLKRKLFDILCAALFYLPLNMSLILMFSIFSRVLLTGDCQLISVCCGKCGTCLSA